MNKRDLRGAENASDPLHKVILAFSTTVQSETADELAKEDCNVEFIGSDVIYHILERFETWTEERKIELEEEKREKIVYPGKIKILADHIFRRSVPPLSVSGFLAADYTLDSVYSRLMGTKLDK